VNAEAIRQAAEMLAQGDREAAARALAAFPTQSVSTARAPGSKQRLVLVFLRDGFTDRYFGDQLVYPGALLALSVMAPDLFPYHRNWKQFATHPAYWSHYPTIDHVQPVARGGADDERNVVTTSMLRNAAKANWLVSELGWSEPMPPRAGQWDGLLPWFCRLYEATPTLHAHASLKAWYAAARAA